MNLTNGTIYLKELLNANGIHIHISLPFKLRCFVLKMIILRSCNITKQLENINPLSVKKQNGGAAFSVGALFHRFNLLDEALKR